MRAKVLGPADFQSMPWRNGQGTTTELAREDDAAGNLLWRLSSADVVAPGPFSIFPGVDRMLMLTAGGGFDLDFGPHGRVAPVTPLVPVRFSGDWPAEAQNVRGPSRDLNLILTRHRATATLALHTASGCTAPAPAADRVLFLAIEGHFSLQFGATNYALHPSQLLLMDQPPQTAGHITGTGALVQIAITLDAKSP